MEGITEDIKVDTMEDTMEDIMEDTMEDIIIVVDIMAAMVDIKYFYESIKISWDLVDTCTIYSFSFYNDKNISNTDLTKINPKYLIISDNLGNLSNDWNLNINFSYQNLRKI